MLGISKRTRSRSETFVTVLRRCKQRQVPTKFYGSFWKHLTFMGLLLAKLSQLISMMLFNMSKLQHWDIKVKM